MTYAVILIFVLLLSPFVLLTASKQDKKSKTRLKLIFLVILTLQLVLGFLNWENFTTGRNGFELALSYPQSWLGLFFIISILQIMFLFTNKSLYTPAIILNFANTILIFVGLIRLGNILGYQAVSLFSILAVFLVLIGNVVGLAFINKEKNLFKKYPF